MEQFLWVIFPYLTLTIFIVVHIYRYNNDQLEWTAKSSEFLEKKHLRWGSLMLHLGVLLALGGHTMLFFPKEAMRAVGISDHAYHVVAATMGTIAGILAFLGVMLLLVRRFTNSRVRANSSTGDNIIIVLLAAVIIAGLYNTLYGSGQHPDFDYRDSIAPWIRGLVTFSPDAALMAEVPMGFKVHILISFLFFAVWPFTRMVHVWSVPIGYIKRSPILYRKRG